jgi:ABC-type multidrug transport system, ATPase and permease components
MEKRLDLNDRIIKIDSTITADDIIVPFEYNLKNDSDNTKIDGVGVILKTKLVMYADGNKVGEYPLKECKEFKSVAGVGCVFIECKYNDEDLMVCRADMSFQQLYAAITKRINKYIETELFSYDYEKDLEKFCSKCGRPLRPGSTLCEHCVNKKEYLKRIWEIARPYKAYIIMSMVLYFVNTGLGLITPYINRILVDDYIKAPNPETVVFMQFFVVILSMLAVNIVTRLLGITRSMIFLISGNKIVVRLRELVFNKIQELSLSRISKRTSGELMNRVTGDTRTLQQFITREMGNIIDQILIFVVVGTVLFVYDWKLAVLILLPMPIVMYINRKLWGRLHRMYNRQWTFNAKASTILHDIFSGIRVVKAFGMEKQEMKRYEEVVFQEREISRKNERTYAIFAPCIGFIMNAGEFFLLYYVGTKILGGEMTIGEMAQFSAYVSLLYGPLRWFSNLPRYLIRIMTSIVKIFDIIDEKVDVADKENAVDMNIEGYIDIENMSFGYDDSTDVLKGINIQIKPGEMIGIVGKSGVGKSTLINLVMRMYDVNEGAIKIDGVDIRDISQNSLRSQIGVVLQETFLFSGSIYDNIAYAKPGATHDEIITASKIAGAHQFIMKLPEAYNTRVGEKGFTLSGGERQRVSIARALLHDPRILILDEATASLDTETEKQIQDSLQKLIKDRTTLAIAHRLSTLRNATRLIVLDKNTVAEVGTHDELIRKRGIYYELVMAQRQMSKMSKDDAAT